MDLQCPEKLVFFGKSTHIYRVGHFLAVPNQIISFTSVQKVKLYILSGPPQHNNSKKIQLP